ncbi:MAG: hypothetical protein WBO31_05755 [Saprospiraceae bacterium]
MLVAPAQLSVPVGVTKFIFFPQVSVPLLKFKFPGQLIIGSCVSLMVIVKLQVAVLLLASVTLNVFVVVPTGNTDPLAKPVV